MAPRRARRPTKPLLLTLTGSAALEVVAAPVEEAELDAPLAAPVVAIKVVPVAVVKAAVVLILVMLVEEPVAEEDELELSVILNSED